MVSEEVSILLIVLCSLKVFWFALFVAVKQQQQINRFVLIFTSSQTSVAMVSVRSSIVTSLEDKLHT